MSRFFVLIFFSLIIKKPIFDFRTIILIRKVYQISLRFKILQTILIFIQIFFFPNVFWLNMLLISHTYAFIMIKIRKNDLIEINVGPVD